MKTSLIIACAGKGTRAKFSKNKLLVEFNGKTTLERTVNAFTKTGLINQYILATSKEDEKQIASAYPFAKTVIGGETRTESIKNALSFVTGDIVLIHDGARPFVSEKLIKESISGAKKFGSAIPVISTADTVCKTDKENLLQYLGKDDLKRVQTPQAFITEKIKYAYGLINSSGISSFNDDGEIYLSAYKTLHIISGDEKNVKLTYPQDFDLLTTKSEYRFGTGFDCHKLVSGRPLILGGVVVPHDKGLLGHSNADVLTHAIMDAILSASANRDIGYHFPDTNEKYKDIDSMELLKKVLEMTKEKGYAVTSISATIMAEKPKLLNYIPQITNSLALALNIDKSKIGISATTLEGLGFVGREEGICVSATATLKEINKE